MMTVRAGMLALLALAALLPPWSGVSGQTMVQPQRARTVTMLWSPNRRRSWPAIGSRWANQGAVAHNMLFRSAHAGVYTWHDPAVRGACAALPRDPRTPTEIPAAAIICQSAMTGAACFWDSFQRGSGTAGIRIDRIPPMAPVCAQPTVDRCYVDPF